MRGGAGHGRQRGGWARAGGGGGSPLTQADQTEGDQTMELLEPEEVWTMLRISRATFHEHVRPHLRPVRIGRRTLYTKEDVEEFVRRSQEMPRAPAGRWGRAK